MSEPDENPTLAEELAADAPFDIDDMDAAFDDIQDRLAHAKDLVNGDPVEEAPEWLQADDAASEAEPSDGAEADDLEALTDRIDDGAEEGRWSDGITDDAEASL